MLKKPSKPSSVPKAQRSVMAAKGKFGGPKRPAHSVDAKSAVASKSGAARQKRNGLMAGAQARYLPDTDAAPNRPRVDEKAFMPDARALAILEGVRIAQENLRQAGGAYDLDQVRTLLRGISRQAIDKRVQDGSLLAVPGPSAHRSFPTLQFNPDGTLVEGLKSVREALPTTNPWTVLNFLTQPESRLDGRKPIDLLKQGEVDLVVEAARRMAQQGA